MKHSRPACSAVYLLTAFFFMGILSGELCADSHNPAGGKPAVGEKDTLKDPSLHNLPEMFLEKNEFDVGEVYEGTAVSQTYTIKNRGKGDLLIKSVKPG